jgi:5'-3' exonuclease
LATIDPFYSAFLPAPYAELLKNPQSTLRHPFDYYPKEAKQDPFGALWDNEFIVELPFINREIIIKEC